MFNNLLKKKRVLVGLTVAMLAVAGAAFAFFTTTGTGTGQATVGTAGQWKVTPSAATGTMYPGAGESTIEYTVENTGKGHQHLAGTSTEVVNDGSGNVESHGVSVAGCLASWFSTKNTSPAAADLASGASETGTVVVTMEDAAVSQDACKEVTPDIKISAS
jgi:hypothetical protein